MIEEIFLRYEVEELIIEVGNASRMQAWIEKNREFLNAYYQERESKVDREKIQFFEPEGYFAQKQQSRGKRQTYLQIFLGKHPYRQHFKIFGGGEVIDESRNFPHNGWNLLLLYARSIFQGNFALWGGLGSQNKRSTKLLTRLLVKLSQNLVLRDRHSHEVARGILREKEGKKSDFFQDFCLNILQFFHKNHSQEQNEEQNKEQTILINLSPALHEDKLSILQEIKKEKLIFFPCDINFDLPFQQYHLANHQAKLYLWTEHDLTNTLSLLAQSKLGIGSRLHFLYCYKVF